MADGLGNVAQFPVASDAQNPDAFLERVLDGWAQAQRSSDFSSSTIRTRRAVVMKLVDSSGHYPWEWTLGDADEFFAHARGVRNLSHSTVRAYQGAIKLFCDYACNPRYDWSIACGKLFGTVFSQVITELNRVTHSQPSETRPAKRPFTQSELQQLFDLADLEVSRILNSGRRGALGAWRDSVALKTAYAWGLRSNELRHLQAVDLSRNYKAPYFGDYGVLRVRWGNPHRGSAKKPRSVLTVWEWSVEILRDWVEHGLPRYGVPLTNLFPTSAGSILGATHLLDVVAILADSARPESIYSWMNLKAPKHLLGVIGRREMELTHDAFDAYSPSPAAAGHLREILVHHGMLPSRESLPFAQFERWLTKRLLTVYRGRYPGPFGVRRHGRVGDLG